METNKQKAKEIRDRIEKRLIEVTNLPRVEIENRVNDAMDAALEMAEYKDNQFGAILDSVNPNAFPSHKNYVEFIKSLLSI